MADIETPDGPDEQCCDDPGAWCAGCGDDIKHCRIHHVCPGGGWL